MNVSSSFVDIMEIEPSALAKQDARDGVSTPMIPKNLPR